MKLEPQGRSIASLMHSGASPPLSQALLSAALPKVGLKPFLPDAACSISAHHLALTNSSFEAENSNL